MMKERLTRLASYLMMVMLALSLNSCGEDDEIAQTLDGIWEGEVATEYFSYRWGYHTEYQAVDIEFYADPYRYAKGTGVEYDYSANGYTYIRSYFDFEVVGGIIYLDYDDGSHIAIRNYHLTGNRFSGEFINDVTGAYLASFDFYRVSNWRHTRSTRAGEPQYKEVPSPLLEKK